MKLLQNCVIFQNFWPLPSRVIFVTFSAFLTNCKRIWNWNLDRNLVMALLIMAIYTVLFEKLYIILRQKEPRGQDTSNFSLKMFKIMRFFRSSICSKTIVELTFTTQNKRLYSLPCLFCFRLENPFWVNMIQKLKSASLSLNLVPRLIWTCWIQWCCSLFVFLTINVLLKQI